VNSCIDTYCLIFLYASTMNELFPLTRLHSHFSFIPSNRYINFSSDKTIDSLLRVGDFKRNIIIGSTVKPSG
jgi:hypothetical protein